VIPLHKCRQLHRPREVEILARELASTFGQLVKFYRTHYGLSDEEARKRAYSPPSPEHEQQLQTTPTDQISWHDLDNLAQTDSERALRVWESVKATALDELRTGHRAAECLEPAGSRCWRRARFLAIRDDLAAEWQPRTGIERQLIDQMAQAQESCFHWMTTLTGRATLESFDDREARELGQWTPPRVKDAEALEQAAGMVDRFNRIFLRTLRALRDLRRYSTPVIVQNAGQVNIEEKQVNVATAKCES
jgi:hypothetical protein